MALLVYLDAGGSADTPTLSAAGYIAREEQWMAFDTEWAAVLKSAGVSALHMKQFAHSTGEFRSWKGDESRRAAFLSQLADVVKRNTLKHVAVVLLVDSYHKLNAVATVRERLGRPYTLTMLNALVLVRRWREENAPSESIALFVEQGDEDQGELFDVVRRIGYEHPVLPLRKSETVAGAVHYVQPFQAADFLAYEYHKNVKMMIEQVGMDAMLTRDAVEIRSRRSFHSLFKEYGRDEYQGVITLHTLGEFCKTFGVYRRQTEIT